MGFRLRSPLDWLAVVLLLGSATVAGASDQDRLRISVLVNNSARVPASVLGRAESEAGWIFRAAGIQVDWVECQKPLSADVCSQMPGANQFVIHLVPTGRTYNDSVFGVAFLSENGTGKYCNVFFDRVEHANNSFGNGVPELLGTVMAHELGHLLLGSQSHSADGIMRPVWGPQSLAGIGMGKFLFTRKQALQIKERFRREEDQRTRLIEGN